MVGHQADGIAGRPAPLSPGRDLPNQPLHTSLGTREAALRAPLHDIHRAVEILEAGRCAGQGHGAGIDRETALSQQGNVLVGEAVPRRDEDRQPSAAKERVHAPVAAA